MLNSAALAIDSAPEKFQSGAFSFIIAGVLGVLLGILLYATRPGNLLENRAVFAVLNAAIPEHLRGKAAAAGGCVAENVELHDTPSN